MSSTLHEGRHPARARFFAALCASALTLSLFAPGVVQASSHREAPFISVDPTADNTDVYAFVSPDRPDTVTLIACFNPFQEPSGGPNYFKFDEAVDYRFHIDNNGDAQPDIDYVFEFTTETRNGNTFLYNVGPITSLDDSTWNVRQHYKVTRAKNGSVETLASNLWAPPVNIGPKSTPNYAALSNAAIHDIAGGTKVFAGQTDDPFFVDLGGIFDLLTIRKLPGNTGGGVDGLKGYNALCIALQVPKSELSNNGLAPTDGTASNAVIGVWSTTTRPKTRVLRTDGNAPDDSGEAVQVSRLGQPLVNEVVIPLKDKNKWNTSQPSGDTQFANYVTNPELGGLFKALYDIQVPPQGDFGTPEARDDLVAIFLTGVPGLNQPPNVTPSEQLRLNMVIPPTANPNSLGVAGGDNAGFPNGRRLGDDVTDIALKAVAGALYPLFHEEFTPDPLAAQLGDGVDFNDVPFRSSFPYLALPHQGFESRPHGGGGGISSAELDARERDLAAREAALADAQVQSQAVANTPFIDLNTAENPGAVTYLQDRGAVDGYADGTFRPYSAINRAEFVKIILEARFEPSEIFGSNCFLDVRGGEWYEAYVCTAQRLGIVGGYPDGTFRPAAFITTEEAYKVVSEVFFPRAVGAPTNPWYQQYIAVANANRFFITSAGIGTRINRGQMALILAKALGYNG